MCIQSRQLCNGFKDCIDGSDEDSNACRDKCQLLSDLQERLFFCDNGSCIRLEMACSAQNHPMCEDGSDMDFSLCEGKCFNVFPFIQDPCRWPCTQGTKKCIVHRSRCDGFADCDDGTETLYSSDEYDCPLFIRIGLPQTILICLALMAVLWMVSFALSSFSLNRDQSSQDSFVPSSSDFVAPDQGRHSFHLHPALCDIDNQGWNWQEVGEQLRLEVIFFNRDPQVLFSFLYQIESQIVHPLNVHTALQGFSEYMTSKGYDQISVAVRMRQTIGHHRLAHMVLKGPPNLIDKKVFEFGKWLKELESKGKVHSFLLSFLRILQASLSPFFLNFDSVKDLTLYLILRDTVKRIEENCDQVGLDCLAASGIEKDILTALLVTLCLSIALTSIDSFFMRKSFFQN